MIDLQNLYAAQGLVIGTRELPDFLPLFLEFLSLRPEAEAREFLSQTGHILAALAERLHKRKSVYEYVFRALVTLTQTETKRAQVDALLDQPDTEPTDLAALDAAWEDEPVKFGPNSGDGCKDEFVRRIRAANRPAPDLLKRSNRPVLPTRGSNHA
jgi:nitrate reductase delta subunit